MNKNQQQLNNHAFYLNKLSYIVFMNITDRSIETATEVSKNEDNKLPFDLVMLKKRTKYFSSTLYVSKNIKYLT